jgi:hypothetical protein
VSQRGVWCLGIGKPYPQPDGPQRALGDALAAYAQLQLFAPVLELSAFPLGQFLCALASGRENSLLSEVHMCALRTLMRQEIEGSKEDATGQHDHFLL